MSSMPSYLVQPQCACGPISLEDWPKYLQVKGRNSNIDGVYELIPPNRLAGNYTIPSYKQVEPSDPRYTNDQWLLVRGGPRWVICSDTEWASHIRNPSVELESIVKKSIGCQLSPIGFWPGGMTVIEVVSSDVVE
jgi:hypothetical protein